MSERALNVATKKRLINNEPFAYAHLIKFERPRKIKQTSSLINTDSRRYGYLTDAAFNISFDDGTTNVLGVSNGAQTYYADKIFGVGAYTEAIDPKATGMNLTLAAESLYNSITSSIITMANSGSTITATNVQGSQGGYMNFMDEGFREGDKILISGGTNSGKTCVITGIKTNGTVLIVDSVLKPNATDSDIMENSTITDQSSGTAITLKIDTDELKGPLVEMNNQSNLKSYHNRTVFVYKVFLNPDDNSIIGAPYLIFKGLVKSTSIVDSPTGILKVNWALTSHWGDFIQVNGRLTNDAVHRALDSDGVADPEVAKKEAYAGDLGFAHAEDTINILATYKHSQEELRYRSKKKFFSLISKTKSYMETVITDRDVDLNFSLSAQYIPVVYGIDKVAGRPIFVDTKSNDSNNVYIAHMLCEGEIGGIYDIYIDGKPSICFNKEDYDDRNGTNGTNKENASVVCRGRADLGQTIGGAVISGPGVTNSTETEVDEYSRNYNFSKSGLLKGPDRVNIQRRTRFSTNRALVSATSISNAQGLIDTETFEFEIPNEIFGTFHSGKEDQVADDTLVEIATSPGFKRQNDYYDDGEETYWSPNHRLLDTAYTVVNVAIEQDATTVPEFDYVVRGKLIRCFNYDYSYPHVPSAFYSGSEAHTNFKVGDSVTIYDPDNSDAVLNADVLIIDKWSMIGPDGVEEYRFRFSDAPNLNYTDGIPAITNFYMKKGSDKWTMNSYNHIFNSGTITTCLKVTTTATTAPSNGPCTWTIPSTAGTEIWVNNTLTWTGLDDIMNMGFTDGQINEFLDLEIYDSVPVKVTQPGGADTNLICTAPTGTIGTGASTDQSQEVITRNQIKLVDGASSTNDAYNNLKIILFAEDNTTKEVTKQERIIEDYNGTSKVATIGVIWDAGDAPAERSGVTYTYKIYAKADRRVSINPAIQLMDYMTSKVYGKNLDADEDLSKSDWLLAARTCDSRGTQTLNIQSATVDISSVEKRYALTTDGTTSGTILAIGKVQSSISSATSIIMEECFGSFTKEFRKNSHSYEVGDIISTDAGYFRCTSAGTKSAKPTAASHSGWSAVMTSFPIFELGTSGSTNTKTTTITSTQLNVTKTITDNASATIYKNPVTFSIYDMSFIKYWRYLGWEQHHQRWVTRHQTCGTVDTSASILDTVGGFLGQMNGMMTYEGGKYCLKIATTTDAISSDIADSNDTGYTIGSELNVRYVTNDDIIGDISLKDAGVSKAYNTVSSQIEMPSTQWKGKSVSFYDSNMLKSDKMIVKSGSLSQPSVINYFNARLNVENFLRKSRFGMTIGFNMGPKALLLKAGTTIKITHDKFGWTGKTFRITNINYGVDCSASITASEYDDSFYTISPPRLPSILNQDTRAPIEAPPGTPTNLAASAGAIGTINLTWTNASGISANSETEIWVNTSSSTYGTILTTVKGTAVSFQHNVGADNAQRWYWIRHKKTIYPKGKQKTLYGAYHGSVNATTVIPSTLYKVHLSADAQVFNANSSSVIQTPNNITFTSQRSNLSAAAVFSSSPSVTLTGSGDTRVLSKANMGSNDSVVITATVTSTTAERAAGADNTYAESVTISRVDAGAAGSTGSDGAAGAAGAVGLKTATGQLFYQVEAASAPSAPSNSSVVFTFATGAMAGGVIGTSGTTWNITPPTASAGATTSKIWYVYYNVTEASAGGGTGTPTFDSTVKQGTGFTNAVTFSSGDFSQNGSAITSIDGGNITTGTIAAARIGAGSFTTTGGGIGGWTINSTSIYTGTEDHSGYTGATGDVTLYSNGTDASIHGYQFYIDTSGNAYFKGNLTGSSGTFSGTVTVGGTSLTTTNTLNTNTTKGDVGLSAVDNNSTATILGSTHTGAVSGNVTGTVNSVAVGTVTSGAASGATANQDSTATIRAVGAATSGTAGGWTISSTSLASAGSSPKITIANEAHTDGPYILISD